MPPKRKKAAARKTGLCVIAPVAGGAAEEAARLAAAAKACPGAAWIFVDRGEGLAAKLSEAPELARLAAAAFSAPPQSGDWGCYCAAAPQAACESVLLLPQNSIPSASLLTALKKAASSADISYSSRLSAHPWAFSVLGTFWKLPGLDFGSPALIRRERLLSLAQSKNPGSYFLGPRLAKEAILSGAALLQVAAPGAPSAVDGFSVLGEGAAAAEIIKRASGYLIGGLLAFLAFAFVLRLSNFLGLGLLAAAFFLMASAFGREK